MLRDLGTPCLIHQPRYSMFDRSVEEGLLSVLEEEGIGCIPFSPLAQGMLTDRYLDGIPDDSRAAKPHGFLDRGEITDEVVAQLRRLRDVADEREQSLAQMALAWVLRQSAVTSVVIGASRVEQVDGGLMLLPDEHESRQRAGLTRRRPNHFLPDDRGGPGFLGKWVLDQAAGGALDSRVACK
jgi:L-glyceraldehyde 3-phosphate reductase